MFLLHLDLGLTQRVSGYFTRGLAGKVPGECPGKHLRTFEVSHTAPNGEVHDNVQTQALV